MLLTTAGAGESSSSLVVTPVSVDILWGALALIQNGKLIEVFGEFRCKYS
jgi:hypothetical protein